MSETVPDRFNTVTMKIQIGFRNDILIKIGCLSLMVMACYRINTKKCNKF